MNKPFSRPASPDSAPELAHGHDPEHDTDQSAPLLPGSRSERGADQPAALLPGIKPVLELLQREPQRVDTLFLKKGLRSRETALMLDLCRAASVRFSLVDGQVLDHLCAAQHQGVVARLTETSQVSLSELLTSVPQAPLPLLLALDQVQDPGNVGTLARTLYALGGAGLLLPKHNSAFLGGAARRAAAGALDRLPVACVTNLGHALDEAEEHGLHIIGTGLGANALGSGGSGGSGFGGPPMALNALVDTLPLPAVLVLGNEGKGLRPGVAKRCGFMVSIPMIRDFDSLNVAQAGAVLLGLLARQMSVLP